MEAPASAGERSPRSLPGSRASSAASAARSELSIDDLSLDRRESVDRSSDAEAGGETGGEPGDAASGMERKLQRNLRAQQAHYARQRRLFEDLRADAACRSPPSPSSQSSSPSAVAPVEAASGLDIKSARFALELPRADTRRGGEESARDAVRRVKDRALADYRQRIAGFRPSQQRAPPATKTASPRRKAAAEELEQQEASNDALRRQLELLRRLQVDNNRFRVENRSLRDRSDALREAVDARDRELELLREEVADKSARIGRDQASLADAAVTAKKLKAAHRQLSAAQSDIDRLREALEEARREGEAAEAAAQEQLLDAASELKRLKKANKQLRQREKALQEDAEGGRGAVEALEQTAGELRTRVRDLKRDKSALATQLADASERLDRLEASTAESARRLQGEVATLQRSLSDERERLSAVEKEREAAEAQLEALESAGRAKDAQLEALKQESASAQRKFQERRRAYREHVGAMEDKLALVAANQRADAETIGGLRRQSEAVARQAAEGDERAAAADARAKEQARSLRRAMDAMRAYVEAATTEEEEERAHAQAAAMDDTQTLLSSPRPRRGPDALDECDDSAEAGEESRQGEFHVARAAASALRLAIMDAVHELQRARHVARQQAHKTEAERARAQEMERRLCEGAAALEREMERRALAEQAREVALTERAEALQWSEQASRKADALGSRLVECERAVAAWLRRLAAALRAHGGATGMEAEEVAVAAADDGVSALIPRADKRLDELLAVSEDASRASERQAGEIRDLADAKRRLEAAMDAQALEAKRVLAEVEALHARSVKEVKERLQERIANVEADKQAVERELAAASERVRVLGSRESELQRQLAALERDVPVLAAVAHLFAATARPLIQQVSDLAAQKRLLRAENASYARHLDRVRCVGQVLKEMLPAAAATGSGSATAAAHARRRRVRESFRRAVVAVFAANRLRQFPTPLNHSRDADSRLQRTVYGLSTVLAAAPAAAPGTEPRARKLWARSLEGRAPVIKVLPLRETAAALPLRALLERLRPLRVPEMLAAAMEADGGGRRGAEPEAGGLVLRVLAAMDADASALLVQNVSGTFHCRALLERRRRRSDRASSSSSACGGWRRALEGADEDEDALPAVELIQRRIMALGKRVEDLHFQRNALQKDSYALQAELEQRELALAEAQQRARGGEEARAALERLQECSTGRERELQAAYAEQVASAAATARALEDARGQAAELEQRLQKAEDANAAAGGEKAALAAEIERLERQAADEEAAAERARADARRQQEEARELRQSVRRAHELYQRTQARLEREAADKAALQLSLELLQRKLAELERELREERIREVERSFDDGEDARGAASDARERPSSPLAVSFEDLEVERPATADSDEESAVAEASDARQARHASSTERFLRDWRRLDVSTAFRDAPPPLEGDADGGEPRGAEAPPERGGASSIHRKPSTRAELAGRSRRAAEIDKVNAAVHDYMDRIDDKLSKMYGIPPSAAIARGHGAAIAATAAGGEGDGDGMQGAINSGDDSDVDRSREEDAQRRRRRRVYG